jgi:hypothetical protein
VRAVFGRAGDAPSVLAADARQAQSTTRRRDWWLGRGRTALVHLILAKPSVKLSW